jgi:hypothetical protein
MLTILIIVALGALAYITVSQIMKRSKSGESIDLSKTLLPDAEIHAEIAKIAETIKSQDPVVVEAPFVAAEKVEAKSKKKTAPAPKKEAPKTKATPKKSK